MPKIIQLDRHVADLIAAGEVVERPASAVKELVENSIDAGAKNITIELQNGGMTFLRITDDGCGMEPVDARTAFLRHATSKIRKKEDLACIGTLGFRGEALAAISSVSKIDLLTRAQGAENGVRLHLEAGKVLSEEPVGCPCGTTILVRELFYNTPARMKFMKSDAAESSAVFSVVQQQALAHPEISFRFLKDGQEQLHTDGQGDRMAAIYAIYGRELANNMLPVDGSWEKLRVRGFVTKPTATRGNRAWQSFFVNNRYIKSRLLSAALEEAYRNQIMVGRFPACVLEIDMPVQAVDVNVHPAKTEVKFLSEREVFDAVHYAVLSTLSRAAGRPEWKTPEKKQEPAPQPQSQPKAVQPPKPGFYQTMQASEYRRQAAQQPVQKPAQPVLASPVQLPRSEPVPAQQSFPLPKPEAKPEVRPEPKPEPKIEVRPEPKPEPVKEPEAQQALSVPEEPFRIAWFKVHEPLAFYAAYFYRRSQKGGFDEGMMCHGIELVKKKLQEIKEDEDSSAKDDDLFTTLEVCYEFYLRGFTFAPIDIYHSHATKFQIEAGQLRPPFVAVAGLGETAAWDLMNAREGREFLSVEEFADACPKVSKTLIDQLQSAGAFGDLPLTSQLTLF